MPSKKKTPKKTGKKTVGDAPERSSVETWKPGKGGKPSKYAGASPT